MLLFVLFGNFAPLVDLWLLPVIVSLFQHKHWIIGLIILVLSVLFTIYYIEEQETEAMENISKGVLLYAVVGLPIAYKLLLTGHYVWVTTIAGTIVVCAYFYRKYVKEYGDGDNDYLAMNTFAPIVDFICIPLVYTCITNEEYAFAVCIAAGLAIISLIYLYLYRDDPLFLILGFIIMGLPVLGLYLFPELTVKIAGWIGTGIFLIFWAFVQSPSKGYKSVSGSSSASAGESDAFAPASSFSFPSVIMSGGETYDKEESFGSFARYRNRSTEPFNRRIP